MKNCKKFAALFTALCMLITMLSGMSVIAAEEEAAQSLSLDFDSFTTNDEASLSNDDWEVKLRRHTNTGDTSGSDLMNYTSVKGALGKAVDDGAMKVNMVGGTLEANADPAMFVRFNPANPIYVDNGEYYEISLDMAWDGPGATKQIRVGIPGDDGSIAVGDVIAYLLNIDASGKVTTPAFRPDDGGALSKSPNYTTAAGAWYNYRFVVRAGENNPASGLDEDKSYHWMYINGKLVSEGTFTHYDRNKANQDKITRFRGFSCFWYLINEKTQYTKYTTDTEIEIENPSITYLDNLKISKLASLPEIIDTKTIDFDAHAVSTDTAATKAELIGNRGYFATAGYQNNTGDVYNIADGVYGKETGDHSLFMQKGADWTHEIDETQFVDYYEAGHHTGGVVDASINTIPGDFYEMEISMAWNGETENKAVQTFYNIDKPGDGKTSCYALNVAANGTVYAMNTSIEAAGKLWPKTWYKFNLVIHAGDNTAENDDDKNWFKLYINDELVQDKTVFVPTARTTVTTTAEDGTSTSSQQLLEYNQFRGFKRYWLTLQSMKTNNPAGTASPGAYYDDFSVRYHGTTEPTYTPVAISSDNVGIMNYINESGMYTSAYMDDRAEGASITASEGTLELLDKDYKPVSSLNGVENHIRITRDDGSVLFGCYKNENTVAKNETFAALDPGTTANFNYAKKAYTVENYEAGIAGKNVDDYALTMRTTDTWADGKDNLAPFLQVTVGEKSTIPSTVVNDVFTVEYSLRSKGDSYATNLLFIPRDATNGEGWYRAITIDGQGIVDIRDDSLDSSKRTDVMATRPGEWVRYALTIYPSSNMIEIYMNDKLVKTQQMWANGENRVARFKIEQAYNSTGETDKRSGEFSVDDFRIYSGARPAMNPVVLESADEAVFDIYNDGDIIFMPGEAVYEDLAANVSGYGTAKVIPNVFTDSTMTEVLTSMYDVLENGNVFMASNDEGLVYEYFYLAEGEPRAFEVADVTNSNGTAASWSGSGQRDVRAYFNCYKDFIGNATVVFAQYSKAGELLTTGFAINEYATDVISGDYAWPVVTSSGVASFVLEDDSESTVKLFVLDGFGSLKPLTDVTILK